MFHPIVVNDLTLISISFLHRLQVYFKGIPPPVITWYRDGFEIHPSRDFQISTTETSSSLHIPEVFAEDSGLFTVKAYNKFGMVQCKAKLTVEGESLLILNNRGKSLILIIEKP